MKYFKCDVCDTIVTEFGTKNHSHKKFTQIAGEELAEKIFTRELEKEKKSELELLIKEPVFIGKSGKVVTIRREGSRIELQYSKHDPVSRSTINVSKEDFYRIIFSQGMVDQKYLHSFYFGCNVRGDERTITHEFLRKILTTETKNGCFAIAFLHDGAIHFTNDSVSSYGTDLIFYTESLIAGRRATPELTQDARIKYRNLTRKMVYGDLLTPRDGNLTVISLNVFYEGELSEKYVLLEREKL